ncbi:MAG TPA: outer membrane beta-barrel protein [Gemmatimonadaceae bacterium]
MLSLSKFAAIVVIAASSAGVAGAQGATSMTKPFSLGISGGASIPTGDLSNYTNTGYNVGGHIALGTPALPISFRGDVNYDNFGAKGSGNSNEHIWSYTANAVYEVPTMTGIRPYVIGGIVGFMPVYSASQGNSTYTQSNGTSFGFDVGGGLTIPLSGFNAFVEARYNRFNDGGGTTSFVPITFGIMF